MKKFLFLIKVLVIVIIGILLLFVIVVAGVRVYKGIVYRIQARQGIDENVKIEVNGLDQELMIRGENTDNPVIIFVHGGPACPMAYASYYYQQDLEQDFTIINYDQRGCGRTYYNNGESTEGITPEMLVDDLDGIVSYAKERFGKDKVIIMGHSWGTVLGSLYAKEHPENVEAYIGVSQVVAMYEGKVELAKEALAAAEKTKNAKDVDKLNELIQRMGTVTNMEEFNIQDLMESTMLVKKYIGAEGEMTGLQQMWTGLTSPDMNLQDMKWFFVMSDSKRLFSIEHTIMEYAFFGFDLRELGTEYEVPVYYLAGEGDYSLPQKDVEAFYSEVIAPKKNLIWIKNSGHSMFMDQPEAFCDAVKECLMEGQ